MSLSDLKIKALYEDAADFQITSNGEVSLNISVSNECNFSEAERDSATITVSLQNLEPFLAGLTVNSAGIDGSCDEVTVKVLRQNGNYEVLVLDNYGSKLHDPYVFWTNDNDYTDPELTALQERMAINPTLVVDMEKDQRFGMSIDMFDTVFADDLPQAFLDGLVVFQAQSNSCETHIILPEDALANQKMPSKYDKVYVSDDSDDSDD